MFIYHGLFGLMLLVLIATSFSRSEVAFVACTVEAGVAVRHGAEGY